MVNADEFKQLVFEVVKLIPKGRATSYGAIARAIGHPNLSRMVGKTMSENTSQNIPAHRVVNSRGMLSGKHAFRAPSTMQELLESEGVEVENDRIKNWGKVFWNPMRELEIE